MKGAESYRIYSLDSWIGLNRLSAISNSWQWSDGERPHLLNWKTGEANNYLGPEKCVAVNLLGWIDNFNSIPFPVSLERHIGEGE